MLSDPWKWVIEASHSQRERCQKSLSLKLGKKCSTIVETLKEMSRLRVQLEKHCNKIFNSGPRCQGNSLIPNLGHTEILCIIWDQLYHSDSQTRTVTVKGKRYQSCSGWQEESHATQNDKDEKEKKSSRVKVLFHNEQQFKWNLSKEIYPGLNGTTETSWKREPW